MLLRARVQEAAHKKDVNYCSGNCHDFLHFFVSMESLQEITIM
jgi:hypothetical protein